VTIRSVMNSQAAAEAIFSILNLECSKCSAIIAARLRILAEVENFAVDYVTEIVRVDYDPNRVTSDEIRSALRNINCAHSGKDVA
jgi:copper chaperone CopZ